MLEGEGYKAEGNKGEKKWDNSNNIINKIYLKFSNIIICLNIVHSTMNSYRIDILD